MNKIELLQLIPEGEQRLRTEVESIDDILDVLSEEQIKSLVAVAGLLGVVASSDSTWDRNEEAEIAQIIGNIFSFDKLDSLRISKLVEVLVPNLQKHGEDFYCKLLVDSCNLSKREAVIYFLQRVAKASGDVSKIENNKISEIARKVDVDLAFG